MRMTMPRYFTSSSGTASLRAKVDVSVMVRCCFPRCSSAWATHLPSGEIAEQTAVPVFVTCFIASLLSTGTIGGGGLTPLNQRTMVGMKRSKARTLVAPAKSAAFLCVLISEIRESAVKIACDLNRVNTAELK